MSTEPFGPWVQPMIDAGAVDPRRDDPVPSWNRLASLAGLSTSTVTMMIDGQRVTSPVTVQKIATALKVRPEDISEWLELSRPVGKRYVAPPEADLLSERQQKALTTFIRALADDRKEGGTDRGTSAPKRLEEVESDQPATTTLTPPGQEEGSEPRPTRGQTASD